MGRTWRKRRKNKEQHAKSLNNSIDVINLCQTLKHLYRWKNETQLTLCRFPQTGRGLASCRTLQKNEILLEIPWRAMISLSAISFEQIFTPIAPMSTQTILATYLCLEIHKGSKSSWKFYLDSLPKENPLGHTALKNLENLPQNLKEKIKIFRDRLDDAYISLSRNVKSDKKCPCCARYFLDRVFTRDLFTWSYAVINTRAVYVDPTFITEFAAEKFHDKVFLDCILLKDSPNMALCPFLDMFNHDFRAETKAEIVSVRGESIYRLSTLTKFRKHDEIFISYGAHDNLKLFVEYGFFIRGNNCDVYRVDFKSILKTFGINLDSRIYNYVIDKGFSKELFITSSGDLSFNLKALFFVCFVEGAVSQFSRIFCGTYTHEELRLFAEKAICLVKIDKNVYEFSDKITQEFVHYLQVELPEAILAQLAKNAAIGSV